MSNKAIIIGAGIAGPLLAIQLKRNGYAVEVYEAREQDAGEGAFLGLTPNGLNVLMQYIPLASLKSEFAHGSMYFYNSKGKLIGELLTGYQKEKYGAETIQVKRGHLHKLLHKAAEDEGIIINYNKRVVSISETQKDVVAIFDDNTKVSGNILFGCDGAFSVVRKTAFANAGKPLYTKNIGTGGFAYLPQLNKPSAGINMTFGERGFFAYAVSNKGEIWWFNNYYREKEPDKEEIKTKLDAEIRSYLLELHKNDDRLFSEIINASHQLSVYPVYDIPKLEKWSTSKICLLGDAAHATSPHVGQGASMAMEDTVAVLKCMAQNRDIEKAFKEFQAIRQQRVERIIKESRKAGDSKSKPNPVATWFRDVFLKYFIKSQVKKLDWIYGYRP
ncbi:FAD-dependent oxidoreductase [Mucilaginibacter ginsenosidivorax]|uniref:Monooxygenase n=1 Tax=Mucilaginibacter ginsenosidivorax TaxID=862126 RepID=A0A5B8W4N4_9SPHI|nr:FAD-dependent monooxygenase [Mucilaginibacter ginsenosidivorax]QEC78703.1 monooxygenase [Mucilaginibacter ginsenosidivorax]